VSPKFKKKAIIFLVWSVAGLLYSAQSYFYRSEIGQQVRWLTMLTVDAPYFMFWTFLTPIAVRASRRFQLTRQNWGPGLTIHISIAAGTALAHAFVYNTYRVILLAGEGSEVTIRRIYLNAISTFDYALLVYFVLLLVINVLDYYKRFQQARTQNAELQTALVQSQLDTLKMKLQPHFLFNTLNSISVLIKDNPARAAETVEHLSDLLRHVLKNVEDHFTSLKQEIDFIQKYLSIEQVRFGERLCVQFAIPENLHEIPVPSVILQPLVENAIRHGIAEKMGPGLVSLKASKNRKKLQLEIFDSGNGYLPEKSRSEFGLGLQITRDRLTSLYAEDFALKFENEANGTRVILEIPIPSETRE